MQIVESSIAKSYLWKHFKVCKLNQNMRLLQKDLNDDERKMTSEFSSWLLNIGDGAIGEPDEENPREASWIKILPQYQIPNNEDSIQKLIDFIYDEETLQQPTTQVLQQKAIVCPKNETADMINEHILS